MVADDDHHGVVRLLANVSGQRPVFIRHRSNVARRQIRQVGRDGHRVRHIRIVEGIGRQHARPGWLIRRDRTERRVARARRKDDEYRWAGPSATFERIQPGQRALVRNAPPAELWPFVFEAVVAVDHVETVKAPSGQACRMPGISATVR